MHQTPSPAGTNVWTRPTASTCDLLGPNESNTNESRWPAIIGIVVGSLILLSVLFCLVQCLCCGVSCAKMLCCCCRGCGRSKSREKASRFRDDYQHMPPTPYSGYQPSPNPMTYHGGPTTATFDTSSGRKINEDSLPAMPSWDTAPTRRVEDPAQEKLMQDVEMGRLAPILAQPQRTSRNGYNQVPNGPMSPTSPTHSQNSYFATHPQNQNADLGAQRIGPYDSYDDTPHSPAPTYHTNPVPATDRFAPGAAAASPYSYQNHQNQSSYAPSSTQYQATDFASTHTAYAPQPSPYHSASPPPMHGARSPSFGNNSYLPYGASPPQGNGGARPPSLLQVGRKAVPGSQREI